MCFYGSCLTLFHPASLLVCWLIFALSVPFFNGLAILVGFLLILIITKNHLPAWGRLLWRAKWLLLTLFLVMAYGTPGELWYGLAWMPSIEGLYSASIHALRLILLLGSLAALFGRLSHQGFVLALWVLAQPLRPLGIDADRTVARLGLVFEYIEHAPPKGSWRHFLEPQTETPSVLETMTLEIPAWKTADVVLPLFVVLILSILLVLP